MEISLQLCKFIVYEILLFFRTSLSVAFLKHKLLEQRARAQHYQVS